MKSNFSTVFFLPQMNFMLSSTDLMDGVKTKCCYINHPHKLSHQQGRLGEKSWVGINDGEMVGPCQISDDINMITDIY